MYLPKGWWVGCVNVAFLFIKCRADAISVTKWHIFLPLGISFYQIFPSPRQRVLFAVLLYL